MLSVPFYYSLFKKYVILFGTLFNNIKIERIDAEGDVFQTIRVPLSYGPREKFLARLEENPTGTATTAIQLPRITFEIVGMNYAPDRKLQTMRTISQTRDVNGTMTYGRVYTPVPYDIQFRMQILTKTTEDGTRILEQILPYFTPEWTVGVKLLENFDTLTDIPLVLNNVSMEDTYEGDFTERRALIHTLDFTMKGYFYGPQRDKKVIKIAFVNLYPSTTANIVFERVTVQPGMTELGEPTNDINLTVPYSQIEEDDSYGYIVTIEGFQMSKDEIGKNLGLTPQEKPGITMLVPEVQKDDYAFARDNLYNIINEGGSALTDLLDVARQSESPRAYEVVSNMIKTLVEANKDLLNIAVTNRDLNKKESEGPSTVNNNLFVGSSTDLLKMLKDKAKDTPSDG